MRERTRIFSYLALYWLSYMVIVRIVFMAYNYDYSAGLTMNEKLLAMLHGLHMDASMTGYFLAFSGLILSFTVLWNKLWISRIITVSTLLFLLLSTVIVVVDVELYRHWGYRMNTTPLMYMGAEAMGSIHPWVFIKTGILFVVLTGAFTFIFIRKIFPRLEYMGDAKKKSFLPMLSIATLMFIPIRGSFTVAPMNTGFVYFHNSKPYANHTAVNAIWNFIYSAQKGKKQSYTESFFDHQQTEALFKTLYPPSDSTLKLVNGKPNVILIILESFTASVVEPLGGIKGLTPNLNQLCTEGVLFDNFFASGDRTDKGLISILAAYPAQTQNSIIKFPEKTQRLPQINHYMEKLGYKSSFMYGGDVDFGNFRSFLNLGSYNHLTTLDDFDDDLYTSKWGVHDQYFFDHAMAELDTVVQPFFKVLLTLSSHEPFDVPMEPFIKGEDPESLFLNSCHYTDIHLGRFIDYCKKQTWWENTLIVITADHGHRHPGDKELTDKERFRIPLLFIGGAVKKDTVIHTMGGQTDIANTLLAQLDKPHDDFIFSKDIMSTNAKPFAVYFFNDGYGFIMPDKFMVHDNVGKRFVVNENATNADLDLSKAYQQKLFLDYNRRDQ